MELTEVLGVRIETALSFLIGKEAVHLDLNEQDVGGRESALLDLGHGDHAVVHGSLAEVHVSLHSSEILERTTTGILEAMVEGSVKHD